MTPSEECRALREARLSKGVRQVTLADALGVQARRLADWEIHGRRPARAIMEAWKAAVASLVEPPTPIMPCPVWHGERLKQLDDLLEQGHTFTQAGEIMNTTKGAIAGAQHRHLAGKAPLPKPKPVLQFPPSGMCLWITGSPRDGTGEFPCKNHAEPGRSFCAEHYRIAYLKRTAPEV